MTVTPQPAPPGYQLTPVLSARYALGPRHVAVVALFCVLFMYLNYLPLFQTDIWGHVAYGKWMLEHRVLPQQDPFLPLGEGMPVVDNAWLSQVILAACEQRGGAEYVSHLFAVVVMAGWLIYTRVFFLLSGRLGAAVAAFALLLFTGFTRHAIVRPEIFGALLFAVLMWMAVQCEPWRSRAAGLKNAGHDRSGLNDRMPSWMWIAVPSLFVVWANMHGSFVVGLAFLGCHALGRVIDTAWRTRSPVGVLSDRWVQRWILLTELAVAASLLNPYGIDLLIHTVQFGRNPNLREVLEWFPTTLNTVQGVQFAISWVVLMVLLRHSRQPMRAADVLLLALFGASVAPTIRMIGWYAPVFALVAAPQLASVCGRIWPQKSRTSASESTSSAVAVPEATESEPAISTAGGSEPRPRFTLSLVCLLLIWCAFALSPISQPVLGGPVRPRDKVLSRTTPLEISAYLRDHPPAGMVFAPQWWGDWLVWDGPPGIRLFATTNIHLIPPRVWQDYLRAVQAEGNWTRTLDKYNVSTLVIDKELQKAVEVAVRRTADWKIVFEDDLGIVAQRVHRDSPEEQ